jgi:hypothetical protein
MSLVTHFKKEGRDMTMCVNCEDDTVWEIYCSNCHAGEPNLDRIEMLEKENEQVQSIAKVAIDRTEELEAEVERFRVQAEKWETAYYKEVNWFLDKEAEVEKYINTIAELQGNQYPLEKHLHSAESILQQIDGEIRVASPTMSGEHNYRITLDSAKRIKRAIQAYFQNKEKGE